MKKIAIAFFIMLLTFAMVACGSKESAGSNSNGEGYPEKQVRMVIPYSPGGASDVIFRLIGNKVGDELGTTFVPANIEGASSTNGSRDVKGSNPDGYTILASHDVVITAYLAGVVDYSYEAFEPVALVTLTPNIAAVNKKYGWKNMSDLIEYVKANPGEVKWGMTPGSTSHYFVAEMIEKAGLKEGDIKLISYQGTADAERAVLSGEIHGTMTNFTSGKGYFDDGSFVALGVANEERLEQLPDSSTMIEQGIDFVNATSRGIFAPKGTSQEIVNKISEAYKKVLTNPDVVKEVENLGSIVKYLGPEEYTNYNEELQERLGQLAEKMDLK